MLAVNALIHTYDSKTDQFVGSSKKRNKVWIDITDQLKGMGFHFTEKQVKNKFHYMQNKFKKMVDANNTSGSGRNKWEFFEDMNDLMGDKPNVRPLNVTETSLSADEEEQSATDDSFKDVEEQGTEPDKEPEKKRKYATAVDKLTNLFDDYWEKKQRADEAKSKRKEERDQKKEERKDKRHKEQADLLRAMIEAMQKKN